MMPSEGEINDPSARARTVSSGPLNRWLIAGGLLSAAAALLHLATIVGGADYYRFFGAGEEMARAAERGSIRPALITAGIAVILGIWSLYAFSGAGLIRRLPLLRTALALISFIYLARAFLALPVAISAPSLATPFLWWSSFVVLIFGLAHAIGLWTAWPDLRRDRRRA